MAQSEELIFTNDNCIGCNKCIRECPNFLANKAEGERIDVDAQMCIKCGACFDACSHDARDYGTYVLKATVVEDFDEKMQLKMLELYCKIPNIVSFTKACYIL